VARAKADRELDAGKSSGARPEGPPRESRQVLPNGDQRKGTANDVALALEAGDARLGARFAADDRRCCRCRRRPPEREGHQGETDEDGRAAHVPTLRLPRSDGSLLSH
jgi:hypothetical protein